MSNKVSVIIPTYNGERKILNVLGALLGQTYKDFEIVIVNDGSTDNTLNIVQEKAKDMGNVHVINQENRGRAAVRNAGAKFANGDLLVFFDDDTRPLPSSIEIHMLHHITYPGSVMTSVAQEQVNSDSSDFFKFRSHLTKRWIRPLISDKGIPLSKTNLFVTAANFSIAKKDFEGIGGFDERLNDNEDYDFAIRAFKAGIPIYFNYEAFAWHDDVVTCASFIKRQRQYSLAQQLLTSLSPNVIEEGFIFNKRNDSFKRLVFSFFAFSFWIKGIDRGCFRLLPKKIRYKLYDIIVTANSVFFPKRVNL